MPPPSTITVYTDLDEYSRFESDKDTIRATVIPKTVTTDLTSAIAVGVLELPVTSVVAFGVSLPYNVKVGRGANIETVQVNSYNGNNMVLQSATVNAHDICDPVVQQVDMTGELISLQLIKARRNRDVVVATEQVQLLGVNPGGQEVLFYLPDIVDQFTASRVRRGSYYIRAISVTDVAVSAITPDFLVSIISVDRFKKEFLHGTDHQALDTEQIKNQPVLVSGVTVEFVSRGHQKGWFPLSYNVSDPNNCGTPVRLLSWCGGPSVAVREGTTRYTLRKGKSSSDYIDVVVRSVDALPTSSVAEDLMVDREPLKDSFFRETLDRAISWVEQVALMCFIEPTRVVTEIDPNQITYPAGSDVPVFVQADWDRRVDAVTYQTPSAGHWINFRMPYYPTITFYSLYGKVSNVRIVDIAQEWIEIDEAGGFVELVPFNQETAFNFIGLIWVESLRGPIPIPNFWNFDALVGFRQTPAIILELISKKAAIDALTLIGQAFRPGLAGQSVSRDGVSESVSYLTAGMYGIFTATIKTYTEWMDKNLPMLRGAYKGVNMIVV